MHMTTTTAARQMTGHQSPKEVIMTTDTIRVWTPVIPARCDHRSDLGLGCARSAGHAGAHWLTARAEEAREALLKIGIKG